jgi:hypothetical protein
VVLCDASVGGLSDRVLHDPSPAAGPRHSLTAVMKSLVQDCTKRGMDQALDGTAREGDWEAMIADPSSASVDRDDARGE